MPVCRECNSSLVVWKEVSNGKWLLHELNGSVHSCNDVSEKDDKVKIPKEDVPEGWYEVVQSLHRIESLLKELIRLQELS